MGELGLGSLTAWKLTGDLRYRDAALACARALARHVRPGDARRSPWPFRVVAETGVVREGYGANLRMTLRLLDEMERLGIGEGAEWRRVFKICPRSRQKPSCSVRAMISSWRAGERSQK